ncbi:MAG: YwiC-like family protein [Acidimicrobiia bacterium]
MTSQDAPPLRSVLLPTEHGGWSLTLEPVLLGLLVEPSGVGVLLGVAALLSFLIRTPMRIVLVDRHRQRTLPRTRLARRVAGVEMAVMAVVVIAAFALTEHPFWWPLLLAAPFTLLELWYDVRSRSRRLVPELAGSVGVASVAAVIALAGGSPDRLAAGLWCIAGARAVAAVTFVRIQLRRGKDQPFSSWMSDGFQLLAVGAVGLAWWLDAVSMPGLVAIAALALVHLILVRRAVPATPIIGAQQVVLGLAVVLTAGLGALAP